MNMNVQQKLRQEIQDALDTNSVLTYDQIHALPYLGYVVKESLRLRPPGMFWFSWRSYSSGISVVYIKTSGKR